VHHFNAEELSVRIIDGLHLIIEGKHGEEQDAHGFISRHFVRRYILPKHLRAQDIHCNLSSDGVLQIQEAPNDELSGSPATELPILISYTGKPAAAVIHPKNNGNQRNVSTFGEVYSGGAGRW